MKNINYSNLPPHCRDSMKRYIDNRIPPGSFLTAVLANDFVGAIGKADHINSHCLKDYASFLYNDLPARNSPPQFQCWGSYEIVDAWIKKGEIDYEG